MNNSTTDTHYKTKFKGNWRLSNVAVMVGGFIVFPPIGLGVLAWLIIGKNVNIIGTIKDKLNNLNSGTYNYEFKKPNFNRTGNHAFDSYKEESIAELEKEMERRKANLRQEETAFKEFVINLQKSKDQAEFSQFMKAQEAAVKAAKENEDAN